MNELLRTRDQLREKLAQIDRLLSDPKVLGDAREMKRIGRERIHATEIVAAMDRYEAALREFGDLDGVLRDGSDPELVTLAREEIETSRSRLEETEARLRMLLVPKDPNDSKNAIVEIRAGTGGDEAALFVRDIYRMYSKFAETKGLRLELMSSNAIEIGGFKEIIFSLEGEEPYATFKFESGVHRVQRVPETEAQGRIHTSAITVAVLPEAEEVEFAVHEKDLKIDVYRSSGPGGQSVNTTDSAVRVTHLPTGLVVQCQDEKSQLRNKLKAMKILRARLLDLEQQKQEELTAAARRSMVSTGDRSAKIRTYNFPQSRVTDHRIGLTLYNLAAVMEGDLTELIQALQLAESEAKLKGEA